MDILSHGLWAGAIAKASESKLKTHLNYAGAFWWGIFPDLFAFAVPTAWMFVEHLQGQEAYDWHANVMAEPPVAETYPPVILAGALYNFSHSLVIFAAVAGTLWFIKKRPPYILMGWLLHILCDIPTHTYRFFPTPFLWPLSGFKISGFSWGQPWFIALNYGLLVLMYVYVLYKKRRPQLNN